MKVGVTGADGFLGWHLRCRLAAHGHDAVPAGRATFADQGLLDEFVRSADVIVHAAGVNRPADQGGSHDDNVALAEALIAAMRRTGAATPVVYANTVKITEPGDYGDAKRRAGEALDAALSGFGVGFVDLVLPHLFGEFGRPRYNSGVATFAHQLAVGEPPEVNPDGSLELLHAQDVAAFVLELLDDVGRSRRETMDGHQISVGDAWALLHGMHRRYVEEFTVPNFASRFELQMFNMLRSHLFLQGYYPRALTLHADQRGAFMELARGDGLGQTSVSTSVPGITRGDHYHFDKIERFVVIGGRATIRLRRLLTDDVVEYAVDGEHPAYVDMPPLVTHNITNTGDGVLTTMFWAGDHFDPAHPDTYPAAVEVLA